MLLGQFRSPPFISEDLLKLLGGGAYYVHSTYPAMNVRDEHQMRFA